MKDREGSTLLVGFDENRAAYQVSRDTLDDVWGDMQPIGSAVDYPDNAHFAELNGCRFNFDKYVS